jgi:preprotein translocase subunit SecE
MEQQLATVKSWPTRVKEFWHDTKSEMRKVTWPSRHEVVGTTGVVLGAVVILGVYLWLCDLAFYRAIDYIFRTFGAGA